MKENVSQNTVGGKGEQRIIKLHWIRQLGYWLYFNRDGCSYSHIDDIGYNSDYKYW